MPADIVGCSQLLYALHIPKTGMCSVLADMSELRPQIYSEESCYNEHVFFNSTFTMLRNPREHILSAYLECKTSPDWFSAVLVGGPEREYVPDTFEEYVHDWAVWQEEGNITGSWGYTEDPLTCYRPIDFQSQRLTCNTAMTYSPIDSSLALENMRELEYLGILEAYQESICIFQAKITGSLPQYCDCTNSTAWLSFSEEQNSHGVPEHDINDYSSTVLEEIDSITTSDRPLYKAAVERFIEDVGMVEKEFGTKIMCQDLMLQPQLQYVLG